VNKKDNKFTSAMGALKGLLDKEGINLTRNNNASLEEFKSVMSNASITSQDMPEIDLPVLTESISINTLNGETVNEEINYSEIPKIDETNTIDAQSPVSLDEYISDIEDDDEELQEFASSFEELEEKVESITDPGHLHQFKHNFELHEFKEILEKQLMQEIEIAIEEAKIKLIDSMQHEINELFKKFSNK
jgi:hypothetical protein